MSNLTNGQLFNLVSGNEITGESTYDIWKSLDGNENKTQEEFIEYMQLGASGLEIDDELSETSTNPVQNKVVTEKFGQLDKEKVDGIGIKAIVKKTQAEYDAMASHDANTLYVIVG